MPEYVENGEALKKDNPDWMIDKIEEKTGISDRYIAGDQSVVDMAEIAANRLIKNKSDTDDIDLLILVTQTPQHPLPSSACILHQRLGLRTNCLAFDINLGCSGYVYALAQAASLIETGLAKKGIIICSEKYSTYIDKNDRVCRPLFSDAAAATLIEKTPNNDGIGPFELATQGSGYENLIVKYDNVKGTGKLHMDGRKIFMFTMDVVPKCIKSLLLKSNLKIDDIDMFIFHQASKIVIDNIIRKLYIPKSKAFVNYHLLGNTVSASIPIAIKQAMDENKIHDGDNILLAGFGVGLSYGGCIIRWKDVK